MGKMFDAVKNKEIGAMELARIISNEVNSFSTPYDELTAILNDEETKEEFQKMSIAFVRCLAKMNCEAFLHDARNEYSCRIAERLVNYDIFKPFLSMTSGEVLIPYYTSTLPSRWEKVYGGKHNRAELFALYMSNDHRTLQQLFASLAFLCIKNMLEDVGFTGVDDYMGGERWYRTPMI